MARFFALVTAVLAAATIVTAQVASPIGNIFTPGRGARVGTDLYFPDQTGHVIVKMTSAGVFSIVAGKYGTSGTTEGNTTSGTALFNAPQGLCTDATDLYVADTGNHRIRKIVLATGQTSTPLGAQAGSAVASGDAAGTAAVPNTGAAFNNPTDCEFIGTASAGNLYIADKTNNKIKAVAVSTGTVTTLAGGGTAPDTDGTGTAAAFALPSGICTDGTNIWVADTNNNKFRKIVVSSGVTTTANGPAAGGQAAGFVNSATVANQRFNQPSDCLYTGTTDVFLIADKGNNAVRRVTASGTSTSWVGSSGIPGSDDITTATTGADAKLWGPVSLVGDASTIANVYVLEEGGKRVRKEAGIASTQGAVTTLAGSQATTFPSNYYACTFLTDYYCTDNVRHTVVKITAATGAVAVIAGVDATPGDTEGSTGTSKLNGPTGIANDGTAIWVVDTGNHKIRKLTAAGAMTTENGFGPAAGCTSSCSGTTVGGTTTARYSSPKGIAFAGTDAYIADTGNHRVVKVTGGTSSIAVGTGTSGDVAGTLTGTTQLNAPEGICIFGITTTATDFGVLIADTGNNKFKGYAIGTAALGLGTTSTVDYFGGSATAGDVSSVDQSAQRFSSPKGCAGEQPAGTASSFVILADSGNNKVKKGLLGVTASTGRGITTFGAADCTTVCASSNAGNVVSSTVANSRWNSPIAVTYVSSTSFRVTDYGNREIKMVDNTGVTSRGVATDIAPSGISAATSATVGANPVLAAGSTDGYVAEFNNVREAAGFNASAAALGSAVDTWYVADSSNHVIRKVVYNVTSGTSTVTTYLGTVGTSGDVIATAATALFNGPTAIVANGTDTLYVADTGNNKIKKIVIAADGTATVTIFAGGAAGTTTTGDVVGSDATVRFNQPQGLAIANGNLYVADTSNNKIKMITPAGAVTIAWGPAALTLTSGSTDSATPGSNLFSAPKGLAGNGSTFVLVADSANHKIRQCSVSAGCTTWLGGSSSGTTDATGTAALFNTPSGVSFDQFGNVYVADTGNNKIRKATSAGVVTSVVGSGTAGSADQATATSAGVYSTATLNGPTYVWFSKTQPTLAFVSDSANGKIRTVAALGTAAVTATATATATNTTTITVTNTSTATVTTAANTTTASTTSSNSTTTAPTTTATKSSNAVVAAATAVVVAVLAIFA